MKCNKFCILIILFFQTVCLSAQSISGRIIDKDKIPMAGVTVLLLNHVDSAYTTGTASDLDGRFEISNLKPDNYILSFSMLGYKKIDIPQKVEQNTNIEQGDIILEEDAYILSEVMVIGKRPPFKVEPGKTIVNLSSALLSTDGNTLDALRKLPGVIVQNDGTIILNGKSGANVLIDDKVTYLSGENLINYLRSIPAKSIENIELITQPASKYDAAGNSGIINIQKKRTTEQGVSLSASSGAERGKYTRWNENLSLTGRFNKLTIYADYSTYWGKDFGYVFASRKYLNLDPPMQIEMESDRKMKYNTHYIRTGVDYDLSDKITIGAYFSYNRLNRKKNEMSISDFYTAKSHSDSTLTAHSTLDYNYTNKTGGTEIIYKLPEKGKWDASFDYQLFDQGDNQMLYSSLQSMLNPLNKDTLSGKTTGDIRIYNGKTNLDYAVSDQIKIATGLKTVFTTINSNAAYENLVSDNWIMDDNLSSSFAYKENINAAYVQFNAKWSARFTSEIGVRLENTHTESSYNSAGQDSVLNQNYTHLFPTLMGQYHPSDSHSFSIAYGRRIVRPNYRDMNPFVEVRDRYLHEKGNTELQPELIDNIEFSWLIKSRFVTSVFYSHRKNPITKSYLTGEDNTTLVIPLNLSENHSAGLKIGLNNLQPLNWWTMHVNPSLTYKRFHWTVSGETQKNELITPMMHINNQLSLPLGWKLEAMGYYNGTMAEGQAKIHPIWSVSMGIRKNFLNEKLGMYIYANDIFHSNRPYIELQSHTNYNRISL